VTRETPKAIHAKAERAALQLLSSRAAGIGEAAVLRHRLDAVIEELSQVNEEYTTALTKLRDNGWSTDELTQLGLTEPLAANTRPGRRTPTRPTPAPRTSGDASLTGPAGHPEQQDATTA
jgi:hypothetical protein